MGYKGVRSWSYVLWLWLLAWVQERRNVGMQRPRLFTVGRLDVATSGLLLVTNDGKFDLKELPFGNFIPFSCRCSKGPDYTCNIKSLQEDVI